MITGPTLQSPRDTYFYLPLIIWWGWTVTTLRVFVFCHVSHVYKIHTAANNLKLSQKWSAKSNMAINAEATDLSVNICISNDCWLLRCTFRLPIAAPLSCTNECRGRLGSQIRACVPRWWRWNRNKSDAGGKITDMRSDVDTVSSIKRSRHLCQEQDAH